MNKLKELADDVVRIQRNLHAIHPEAAGVKVHIEELAEVVGGVIAHLSALAGKKSAPAEK
jgi:hypothetical protein